ncbi:hypothetical protein ATCM_01130 [Stenotrophomonas sp. ATCM1_4]|nr:hypothetical protein ATCM_01130 [Stenotrophomonas sp. ATCM1_4]
MGAMIFHEFERGFCLTEEGLRRIQAIIKERIPRDCIVTYVVTRGDAFTYRTKEIDDVLDEVNDATRQVVALEVEAQPERVDREEGGAGEVSFRLMLVFRSARTSASYWEHAGCTLEIQGADRDAAYLMLSELKNYISSDVANLRRFDKSNVELFAAIIALVLLLTGVAVYILKPEFGAHVLAGAAQEALKSTDISEKLNYLISVEAKRRSLSGLAVVCVLAGVVAFGSSAVVSKTLGRFFPTDIFAWGKRKQKYDSDVELRGKLFWGLAVAFAVSIVAGVVVWRITI